MKNENREKLIGILTDICPDVDFENEDALIDDGLIESLDIVAIVTEIMAEFDVEINVDDLLPENFQALSCCFNSISVLVSTY